ncbi:hypothetical protein COL5a_006780 [Colletotrichum fioriniae]|uniref:3'-phosphoadenosine 5'-phosphosulfate sulfotransferase n=1 Tax=Colletotrichum fioriniae TaxID=710243 RepID=UPI0032DAF7D6|nr:hypothetical protein COL5a_006780 [Colletotrichum fioriniae]KAJ3949894.1 3'-phosphoadenosine 5'-phosphosulfate sulfotransferase [Colletotrichum fioriniae]
MASVARPHVPAIAVSDRTPKSITFRPIPLFLPYSVIADLSSLDTIHTMSNGNGEHAAAAANGYPAKPHSSESPRSFQEVCHDLKDKVDAFLANDQKTDVLRNVQKQLRASMGVVDEALARYRCAIRDTPCQLFSCVRMGR